MGHPFHIVDNRGTCRREARHGLKERISDIVDITSYQERGHTKQTEYRPSQCHQKISVTTTQIIRGIAPKELENESTAERDERR